MAALIQKYGDKIDGVWADAGLQASGAIEAYVAAGGGVITDLFRTES